MKSRQSRGNSGAAHAVARYGVMALFVAGILSLGWTPSAVADGVSVVDPKTGHRIRLPDNDRDGRADYVPRRLDIHVNPGLTSPRESRQPREPPSSGGSICHGGDGGSTVSTARRACDPSAPAGDGGPQTSPNDAPSRGASSTPTRPNSSSSTQLD